MCLLASPVLAEDQTAPDYFVDTVVATGVAQQLARACPTLSLNPQTVAKDSDELMNQLAADGVMSAEEMPWAEDANTRIEAQVQAFLTRTGLDEPTQDKVCDVGLTEIAEETAIGRYLLEVPA
nr:DUF5333 family protein [Cognatishimia sp. MH4019]